MRTFTAIFTLLFGLTLHAEIIHLTNIKGHSHDGQALTQLDSLLFDAQTGRILAPHTGKPQNGQDH